MEDFELDQPSEEARRQLVGWSICHSDGASLVLSLKYAAAPKDPEANAWRVSLVMPPEAALYLSEELERQARRILQRLPRGSR